MLVLSEDYSIKKFDFIDKEEENECLILENAIIFKSGRALVKAENENKAKAILDGYLG